MLETVLHIVCIKSLEEVKKDGGREGREEGREGEKEGEKKRGSGESLENTKEKNGMTDASC